MDAGNGNNAPEGAQAREPRDSVVVRFAGDSGDGMQLTGSQFTLETALIGNDLRHLPGFSRRDSRSSRDDIRGIGLSGTLWFGRRHDTRR